MAAINSQLRTPVACGPKREVDQSSHDLLSPDEFWRALVNVSFLPTTLLVGKLPKPYILCSFILEAPVYENRFKVIAFSDKMKKCDKHFTKAAILTEFAFYDNASSLITLSECRLSHGWFKATLPFAAFCPRSLSECGFHQSIPV
jgi:hypothetical protein